MLPPGQTDLNGLCYLQGQWWHPAQAIAEGHIWVLGFATAGVSVDVCALYYKMEPYKGCMLKSEGCAKQALLFADPGRSDPAPPRES